MIGNKKRVFLYNTFYIAASISIIFPAIVLAEGANSGNFFNYPLMESLPLIGQAGDVIGLAALIVGFYKLLLWIVTIGALFMLSVGAFYYMTAAGNTSNVTTAKKIIGDSLLGLVIALISWTMLYIINPDLTKGPNINLFRANNRGSVPPPTYQQDPNLSQINPNWPSTPAVPSTETQNDNVNNELNTTENPDYCADGSMSTVAGQDMCYTDPEYVPAEYTDFSTTCTNCQPISGIECQSPSCQATGVITTYLGVADANVKNDFAKTTTNPDGTTTTTPTAKLVVTRAWEQPSASNSTCYTTGTCADVQIVSTDPSVVATDPSVVQRAYQSISDASPGEVVTYHTSDCSSYSAVGVSCVEDGGSAYFKIGA